MSLTKAQFAQGERVIVILGMVVISLLSWAYMLDATLFSHAGESHDHTMASPSPASWDGALLVLSIVMWCVMMIAMMLPTALPMVLSFTRVQHQRQPRQRALRLTWIFVTGYLIAWSAFSVLAAICQWLLHGLGLLSSAMGSLAPVPGGVLLIAAGLFQWSGLKDACLSKCQSPLGFLLNEWRNGAPGALVMGLRHGLFCIGCCWMLMLLMFVGGVMNLAWMAVISVYVLAEKLVPRMQLYGRLTGALLILAGLTFLVWSFTTYST